MTMINQDTIKKFLDKKNVFAVIGVSENKEKYGNKVYFDLKNAGYKVFPINPNCSIIADEKCYANLDSLPTKPDVVDIVVPPKVTEQIVKKCKDLGIKKVWMQPGSESEDAINFCLDNNITVLYDVCVMMERRTENSS